MKNALVGSTGFVGSNLIKTGEFQGQYHSKNIQEAFGTKPELLVYAGIRAEKFIANQYPEKDCQAILDATENIRKIQPNKLVLISTVDVYPSPINVDERTPIENILEETPYGRNRYLLENMVKEIIPNTLILRLPGLFGDNIKKNFIYDLIHFIPSLLKPEKYQELYLKEKVLKNFYFLNEKNFYQCRILSLEEKTILKKIFEDLKFSALNFTDSRSVFQFYSLNNLWRDIQIAMDNQLSLLNLATEPISAGELYFSIFGKPFDNQISSNPAFYDFRTIHAELFNGKNGYITSKKKIVDEIITFVGGVR